MINEEVVGLLFSLLQSGDEALDYLCVNVNNDDMSNCVELSQTLEELYINIAAFTEINNVGEKHRGREAALNAADASNKLRCFCNDQDIEKAVITISYELLPLHVFLKNELNFWYALYPDIKIMREHRDIQLSDFIEYAPTHKETLEMEYNYDVSIMVLCYNKAYLTKIALESIIKYTNFDDYSIEVIIVNNGSNDNGETTALLEGIDDPRIKTVDLKHPLGYNGYSLGPLAAQGRYFVEFHTDVVATENWLDNLITCISSDPRIGAVVAVCNESSNYQTIPVCYKDPKKDDSEMQRFAKEHNHSDPLKWEEKCRLMPTSGYVIPTMLYRQLLRDPWLYFGQFTDDDMSMYLRRAGFKQILAKDTFLHHFGSQTSSQDITANDSIQESRRRFFVKWQVDAWYSVEKNMIVVDYIKSNGVDSSDSFLFIDPYFGSTPMSILDQFKSEDKKRGEIYAVISDLRYIADTESFYDKVITASVKESLLQVNKKFDYIVFNPDIKEYIDGDFPELLKALRLISKSNTKVLFTMKNANNYLRLYELINGKIPSDRPFEPLYGMRNFDPVYIKAIIEEHGFVCSIESIVNRESEQHKEIIRHLQGMVLDKTMVNSLKYDRRLFVLTPKP